MELVWLRILHSCGWSIIMQDPVLRLPMIRHVQCALKAKPFPFLAWKPAPSWLGALCWGKAMDFFSIVILILILSHLSVVMWATCASVKLRLPCAKSYWPIPTSARGLGSECKIGEPSTSVTSFTIIFSKIVLVLLPAVTQRPILFAPSPLLDHANTTKDICSVVGSADHIANLVVHIKVPIMSSRRNFWSTNSVSGNVSASLIPRQ